MTESLLTKLEEKMMLLLAEVERLRAEVHGLKQVQATMQQEKEANTNKLKELLSLFDAVIVTEDAAAA